MGNILEVAKKTDVHRDFRVIPLDDVRMAASAMQVDLAHRLIKMRSVVEHYTALREGHL